MNMQTDKGPMGIFDDYEGCESGMSTNEMEYELQEQLEQARIKRIAITLLHYATMLMLLACIACACYLVGSDALPLPGTIVFILLMFALGLRFQYQHVHNRK